MISSKQLEAVGQMTFGRFVTTYRRDYNPFREHHLEGNPRRPITDVGAAPPFVPYVVSPQAGCDIWPIFYKTTNSDYGSAAYLQPPSYSLPPASLPRFGILPLPVFEASAAAGSTLTEARTQDTGVARETWPVVCEEEKGLLHYAKVFDQREAKDEPQHKCDVLYEEGVISLPSLVCPACSQDHIRSVCREAELQALLHLPVTPSPIIQIKDAGKLDNISSLKDFMARGPKISTFLQPFPRQCLCCVCKTEFPYSCSFTMPSFSPGVPCSSTVQVAQNVNCRDQSRKPLLTEYQANYTAKWTQSQIQNPHFPNPRSIFHSI